MTPLVIGLLAVQGVLFAVWAFLMFRALFGILGRYRSQTGKAWIGPVAVIGVYYRYLQDPAFRREKWLILLVLALYFAVTVISMTLQSV